MVGILITSWDGYINNLFDLISSCKKSKSIVCCSFSSNQYLPDKSIQNLCNKFIISGYNQNKQIGELNNIQKGINELYKECDYILKLTGDDILSKPENINQLINILETNDIICPQWHSYCSTMIFFGKSIKLKEIWDKVELKGKQIEWHFTNIIQQNKYKYFLYRMNNETKDYGMWGDIIGYKRISNNLPPGKCQVNRYKFDCNQYKFNANIKKDTGNILEFHNYSEFGWEICSIIPNLRALSRKYDKTIVYSFKGMEYLYKDFAEWRWNESNDRLLNFEGKVYRPTEVEFRKYGVANSKYDILIHARGAKRKSGINYKQWKKVLENLKEYKVAFVGSKEDQIFDGYDDLRGIELEALCNFLAGSKCIVGCSSGVMHLASACGCNQVVWGDTKTRFWETLKTRYQKTWNPFHTRVEYIFDDLWQPESKKIIESVHKLINIPIITENPIVIKEEPIKVIKENKNENNSIKCLLTSSLRLGDVLSMTAAVRDLKKKYGNKYLIRVQTSNMDIWKNNPHLSNFDGVADIELNNLLGKVTGTKTSYLHITEIPKVRINELLHTELEHGNSYPDLYLTDEEKKKDFELPKNYWIINTSFEQGRNSDGSLKYGTKAWEDERFQEVVDKLPWITFVQTGIRSETYFSLKGNNVIDFVGKTNNLRDLFSLFYNCSGVICLVGGNMHMAGAFKKPAVIIAGSSEPVTFEKYPFHRYIHNIGALNCSGDNGCWKSSINSCLNIINGIPKCKDMITSDDVVKEVLSYYEGEKLEYPIMIKSKPKIFRLVANCQSWGGAEKSSVEIMKMAQERGYQVEYSSRKEPCLEFKQAVPFAKYTDYITDNCDIFVFYASDMVFDLHKEEFNIFKYIKAKRKIMAITYRLGKIGEVDWTKKWDGYIFLCSDLRNKLLERLPKAKTYILPPPVDLTEFYKIERNFNTPITLLRYSSQGDTKYNENVNEIIKNTKCSYKFMPAPSFIIKSDRVITYGYNQKETTEFLKEGTCGWYSLPNYPQKYLDNGSRVILEMLASGIPVIGDNWGGCKSRLNSDIGWLCNNKEDYINIINNLTIEQLTFMGVNARKYAKEHFKKEAWIALIMGEENA